MRRVLVVLAAVTFAGVAAACANQAILDPASLSSFFDIRVINDTRDGVVIQDCAGDDCRRTYGLFSDSVPASGSVEEAAWNSVSSGGIAAIRIIRGHRLVGCFKVHYRKGQEHGTVRVSQARRC